MVSFLIHLPCVTYPGTWLHSSNGTAPKPQVGYTYLIAVPKLNLYLYSVAMPTEPEGLYSVTMTTSHPSGDLTFDIHKVYSPWEHLRFFFPPRRLDYPHSLCMLPNVSFPLAPVLSLPDRHEVIWWIERWIQCKHQQHWVFLPHVW